MDTKELASPSASPAASGTAPTAQDARYSQPEGAPRFAPAPVNQAAGPAYPAPAPARRRFNPWWLLLIVGLPLVLLVGLLIAVVAGLVGWFAVGGIKVVDPGPLVSESRTVQLNGATAAQVTLNMDTGTLKIGGGATDLMKSDFSYNIAAWEPKVDYSVSGGVGKLQVEQAGDGVKGRNSATNDWNLSFNNDVPLALNVSVGAGSATMQLGNMGLSKLDVNAGVGVVTIDLTGAWRQDLKATIAAGVGDTVLKLPADTGVRVTTQGGVGGVHADGLKANGKVYSNDVYGKTDHNIDITVQNGVGNVQLSVEK